MRDKENATLASYSTRNARYYLATVTIEYIKASFYSMKKLKKAIF